MLDAMDDTMDDARHDPLAWVAAHAVADPVRQRVLEGLARRAASAPSQALRAQLVARLLQRAGMPQPAPALPPREAPPRPLAALVTQLQAAGTELRHVQAHEGTWRALRLNRRLAEVSAPVPEHLGPLNSQVLVARALQELKTLSPDYLQRLLTQLDALAALGPLTLPADADKPTRPAAKRARAKRPPVPASKGG